MVPNKPPLFSLIEDSFVLIEGNQLNENEPVLC